MTTPRRITPADLRNPARQSGYDHVNGNGAVAAGKGSDVWRASWRKGAYENDARGPARKTPFEAAQDYCDYINSGQIPAPMPALKSAGHAGKRASLPMNDEVQEALGILRDARAARKGAQGYVYLIVEDLPGGALHYGKVGFSTNPSARIAELQTGNPRKLRLLCSKPGTEADEAALHAKYAHNNVLQEWFFVTKELLREWDTEHQIDAALTKGVGHHH